MHTSTEVLEEAQKNLCYFGLAGAKPPLDTAPAIEAGLATVLAGKRPQLLAQRGAGYVMQFYCWHDAQASQLRFSLVAAAAALPFQCPLRLVELSGVVQEFLMQAPLVFDQSSCAPDTPTGQLRAEQAAVALPIWRTIIP